MQPFKTPVILIIRDGWGENSDPDHSDFNALEQANIPYSRSLSKEWPRSELITHGLEVGLPESIMGNSEVGHQNIGAGRIVDQEIVRINKNLCESALTTNPCLTDLCAHIKQHKSRLHLMGLVSDGGVHSQIEHLYRLLRIAKKGGITEVYIHVFTDGRDTAPFSALNFIESLEAECLKIGIGKIATVIGRFWAMDRDHRWERTQKAYDCITGRAIERTALNAKAAIQLYYDNPLDDTRKGDEFVVPAQIVDAAGKPIAIVKPQDAVLFFNFRGDRPRQLTRAFVDKAFTGFDRGAYLPLFFATLTDYERNLCPHVVFHKPPKMHNTLGMYLSHLGIPQFRAAETEKYPHVTFFFNDYQDEPFPLEERQMVPSPKEVLTYDLKPEMSAWALTEITEKAILSKKYGFIVVNFANLDMVGHTGSLQATIKACETIDACVKKLLQAVDAIEACAIVTADHGNAEQMWDPEIDTHHTRHTLNPVELLVYGKQCASLKLRPKGCLADIAPTILDLMHLEKPTEMTGTSLIQKYLA
jgi:2,3-bisphosphoglycerate-independent phosphoglycerate mutase